MTKKLLFLVSTQGKNKEQITRAVMDKLHKRQKNNFTSSQDLVDCLNLSVLEQNYPKNNDMVDKVKRKVVCIDLDGTICKQQGFGDGFIEGEPKLSVKEALNGFKKAGYKIIILTVRLNPSFGGDIEWKKNRIIAWMNKYELPFDEITNNKPSATLYIDNKAVKFMDWDEVIRTWKLQ